jgi:PIN domain nuclease of toxin-antitoxin system
MTVVIDAAALMCLLLDERGADQVLPVLRGSIMSAVNLSESFSRSVERGATLEAVDQTVRRFEVDVRAFTAADALDAAKLRPGTKHVGASLGDRACLALAQRLSLPMFTADTRLGRLTGSLPIDIRLIR